MVNDTGYSAVHDYELYEKNKGSDPKGMIDEDLWNTGGLLFVRPSID